VRPVIAASLPSKRCGKRESRVQTGGPATVGKTTFVNRFRDHWVCDGHIHKPEAV
jgi:GTPase SAR1 family protein